MKAREAGAREGQGAREGPKACEGERRDNPAQPCEFEGHCLKENKHQKEHISAETPGHTGMSG